MGAAPPGERALAEVLRPGKKQQQTEHDLDVHRDHERRADVEVYGDRRKRGGDYVRHGGKLPAANETRVNRRQRSGLLRLHG